MKRSAGWGSACDPCAKAKTRCIRAEHEKKFTSCNSDRVCRCNSLDISCKQQVRKPRKKRLGQYIPTPSSITDTPICHNEDGGAMFSAEETNTTTSEPVSSLSAEAETKRNNARQNANVAGSINAPPWLPGFEPFPSMTCACVRESDGNNDTEPPQSVQDDEDRLSIYRAHLSSQFPFVIIPEGLNAAELQRSKPFLAKVVQMMASLQHRPSMWERRNRLMRHIAEAVYVKSESSLDLVQGIIVLLGFYQYFCLIHGHFNSLSHLAASMIADMRLDRSRARPPPPPRKLRLRGVDPEEPKAISNDERRAILAVWYINSTSATVFYKVNSPSRHFTQHMEQCLQHLQDKPEYKTDEVLVQLINAQRMNEMVSQLHHSDQLVDIRPSSNAWIAKLDSLLAAWNDRRRSQGQHRHQNHCYLLLSHHNYAMLQLLEPQLVQLDHSQNCEIVAALKNTPEYFHGPKGHKEAGIIALRAWFEYWLTIPVCYFFYMPLSGILQLMNAAKILLSRCRIMLLAHHRSGGSYIPEINSDNDPSPAYTNTKASSSELMLDLLERLASRLEQARIEMTTARGDEWVNGFLDLAAWKLRERVACMEKWIKIIATETNTHAQTTVQGGVDHEHGDLRWDEGEWTASHTVGETGVWPDPVEAFLLGGDAYESWLWTSGNTS